MPRFEWNDGFSVNVEELDHQHKKWISIINDLHEILISGNVSVLQKATEDSLDAMLEYALMHFAYEERYMEKIGYPGLLQHREKHLEFKSTMLGYYTDIKSGTLILSTKLMKTLINWLKNHILEEDKQYAQYNSTRDQQ